MTHYLVQCSVYHYESDGTIKKIAICSSLEEVVDYLEEQSCLEDLDTLIYPLNNLSNEDAILFDELKNKQIKAKEEARKDNEEKNKKRIKLEKTKEELKILKIYSEQFKKEFGEEAIKKINDRIASLEKEIKEENVFF
jgi:hypothetical protein